MAGELSPLYIDGACASALAARYLQGQMICREGVGGDWYDPDDSFLLRIDPTDRTHVIAKRGVAFIAEDRPSQIPAYYFVASDEDVSVAYVGQPSGVRNVWLVVQDSNEQGTVNGWTLAFFAPDWSNPTNLPALLLGRIAGDGQTMQMTIVDLRQSFHTCTTGEPNSLQIGTVTTSAPGAPAAANIVGNPPSQTLNLTLPRGQLVRSAG